MNRTDSVNKPLTQGFRAGLGLIHDSAGLSRRKVGGIRGQAGLTLIEIMVVIVIIGVLAALIVPRVMTRPDEARAVAAKQDLASIMQALKLYRLDNQTYPTSEQGLAALVTRPSVPPEPSQ